MSYKKMFNYESQWITEMGAWFPGEKVIFRDHDLFEELNEKNWLELMLFGITNKKFNENQIALFNAMWVICTSYPDPRIWNNRITALAGTARSTCSLAISAATAVSEATIYGRRPDIRAIDFFIKTQQKLDNAEVLNNIVTNEIRKYRGIAGYGRPVINVDERIEPLIKKVTALGFSQGKFLRLAFEVEDTLKVSPWPLVMNVGALLAALSADQGLTPREHYAFMTLCFSAGMFPCFIDAENKPEGSFFPLRCDIIKYEGKPIRKWD